MSSYLYFNDGTNLEKNSTLEFSDNSRQILERRYLLKDAKGNSAETPEQMFERIANVMADPDAPYHDVNLSRTEFYNLVSSKKFFPNSPTFTGAGTPLGQLSACFVLPIADDLGKQRDGIFSTLNAAALIQQVGGGNGFSFSKLRSEGTVIGTSNGKATGPIGFMRVYNAAFGEIAQGGVRRGANMGVLKVNHPDIRKFVKAKADEGSLSNFNLSVAVTDEFMRAVKNDTTFDLIDPHTKEVVESPRAREIFDLIVDYAYRNGEPGVLFVDVANKYNPVPHLYELEATNPCGEQWLGPYENCCLGSINLKEHLNSDEVLDWNALKETVILSTRFLDNVVTANKYVAAVPELRESALNCRRIGLGFMGLADVMYFMGIRYGSEEGQEFAAQITEFIRYHSMKTSIELAKERGPFLKIKGSIYDPDNLKWTPPVSLKPFQRDWNRPYINWQEITDGIRMYGIRNAAQTTVAPTGTISTVAGVEGYGCEPVFALAYYRNVYQAAGAQEKLTLTYVSPAFQEALDKSTLSPEDKKEIIDEVIRVGSCQNIGKLPTEMKNTFVVSSDISPDEHIKMQAAIQAFVDNSISKTCNFPANASKEDVAKVYMLGWELGCKGLTVYVAGSRQEVVLETKETKESKESKKVEDAKDQNSNSASESLIQPSVAAGAKEINIDGDIFETSLDRGYRLQGSTYKVKTPQGKAFITINRTASGKPLEVFLNVGKAGTDVAGLSEGLGRLISGWLRMPTSSEETVREIISQLTGIGGSKTVGFGKNKITSIPDAVAKVLAEELGYTIKTKESNGNDTENGDNHSEAVVEHKEELNPIMANTDMCPECGNYSLVLEEGCCKCYYCGYSAC